MLGEGKKWGSSRFNVGTTTLSVSDLSDVIVLNVDMSSGGTTTVSEVGVNKERDVWQGDLDKMLQWSDKWLMKLNCGKCKVMKLGMSENRDYHTGGHKLQEPRCALELTL